MKVLIVCSYKPLIEGGVAPFISDQVYSIAKQGVEVEYFLVKGKGIKGYLTNYNLLRKKIKASKPDVIHAHYGLSGVFANLQCLVPVITTYHGSDINLASVFRFSKIAMSLSSFNVFVSEKNLNKASKSGSFPGFFPRRGNKQKRVALIPCGVDMELFVPTDKLEARLHLGLEPDKKYVLFAGAFDNQVKNAELAIKAIQQLSEVELLELRGYSRAEVSLLMNAVDAVLMTSHSEGSPQFIKEAMACNCPIVSVSVGDVPDVLEGLEGCYLAKYETEDVAEILKMVMDSRMRTDGRNRIAERGLDAETVAKRIVEIYRLVINR